MGKRVLLLLGVFSVLTTASGQSHWISCPSQHGTGHLWFNPVSHRAQLYLNGFGKFHGKYPIEVDMTCRFDDDPRAHWNCDEVGEAAHPDGRHSVGIDISYGKYLPVATRDSAKYGANIVVDDFGCRM